MPAFIILCILLTWLVCAAVCIGAGSFLLRALFPSFHGLSLLDSFWIQESYDANLVALPVERTEEFLGLLGQRLGRVTGHLGITRLFASQGDHGIYAHRAAGGEIAGGECDKSEQDRHAGKRQGIAGADAEEQA